VNSKTDSILYERWHTSNEKNFAHTLEIISEEFKEPEPDHIFHSNPLRKFLLDLQTKPNWYKKRIIKEFFHSNSDLIDQCVGKYFKPTLVKFFQELVEIKRITLARKNEKDIDLEEAISEYVKDGKFKEAIKKFCKKEDLNHVNLDYCSKVFYKVFKEHFDSRKGCGMMEMINVGKKHPKELEKMMLMKEYDDIRSTLLRLQLTGEIDSLNYQ
jgi:hypothetical protein